MFLFDILFGLCLFAATKLFDMIFLRNETAFIGTAGGYLLLLGYFLVIVLAHSFFKYCLFDCFQQIEQSKKEETKQKTKFTFENGGIFYAWNLMMYSVLGLGGGALYLFFAVSLITVLKQPALIILALALSIGGYFFVQTSHIVFFQNNFKNKELSLKQIPKKVWQSWEAKRVSRWIGWNLLWGFAFFAIYFLLYLGVMTVAQKAATDATAMTEFYVLNVIIFVFLVLVCYFLLLWNRIYLFLSFGEAK